MPAGRGRAGRAVGDACRADRGQRVRLARLPARRGPRPAVRIPGARSLRPGARAPLQPGQAAARPVQQGHQRRGAVERGAVQLPLQRPRRAEHGGQRPVHADQRGHQPLLRLGGRPGPADPLPRDGHLRGARPRPDPASPGRAGRAAGHVRRDRPPGGRRAPGPARRHRGRADAGAPVRARAQPAGPRADQLLGLQHDRVPRPAQGLLVLAAAWRPGRRVQGHGQGAARGRASR